MFGSGVADKGGLVVGTGAHESGNDARRRHASAHQLSGQPVSEAQSCELGCGVWQQMGRAHDAAHGGDHTDVSATTLPHRWKNAPRHVDGSLGHDVERLIEVLQFYVCGRPHLNDAGHVNRHLDGAIAIRNLVDHALHALAVSDVHDVDGYTFLELGRCTL